MKGSYSLTRNRVLHSTARLYRGKSSPSAFLDIMASRYTESLYPAKRWPAPSCKVKIGHQIGNGRKFAEILPRFARCWT